MADAYVLKVAQAYGGKILAKLEGFAVRPEPGEKANTYLARVIDNHPKNVANRWVVNRFQILATPLYGGYAKLPKSYKAYRNRVLDVLKNVSAADFLKLAAPFKDEAVAKASAKFAPPPPPSPKAIVPPPWKAFSQGAPPPDAGVLEVFDPKVEDWDAVVQLHRLRELRRALPTTHMFLLVAMMGELYSLTLAKDAYELVMLALKNTSPVSAVKVVTAMVSAAPMGDVLRAVAAAKAKVAPAA